MLSNPKASAISIRVVLKAIIGWRLALLRRKKLREILSPFFPHLDAVRLAAHPRRRLLEKFESM